MRGKLWLPEKYRGREQRFDLLQYEPDEPARDPPGVYVVMARATAFSYPLGKSRVFYIGQTGGKRKTVRRLEQRRRWALQALEALQGGRCDSRSHPHEGRCVTGEGWVPFAIYAARFGAKVTWISRHGRESPQDMEAELIGAFYDHYGALPVANRQWPRRLRDRFTRLQMVAE